MASPTGRIEPGQPLESAISARAWNRAQDAADIVLGAGTGTAAATPGVARPPYITLRCRNDTADPVIQFGVLSIRGFDALDIKPTSASSLSQFRMQPVLSGEKPGENASVVGVAIEPIGPGKIGMVAVSGVVQIRLNITSLDHWYAKPQVNNVGEFITNETTGLPILWKPEQLGIEHYALVYLQPIRNTADTMRLGQVSNGWTKGQTKTVTRYNGNGVVYAGQPSTFEAINKFATISGQGQKWVACALIDSTWHLVAAEC